MGKHRGKDMKCLFRIIVCILLGLVIFGVTTHIVTVTEIKKITIKKATKQSVSAFENYAEKVGEQMSIQLATRKKMDSLLLQKLCVSTDNCTFLSKHVPPFAHSLSEEALQQMKTLKESVILVVLFNRNETYFVAPLVHKLYEDIFVEVRYCGPSELWDTFPKEIGKYFEDSNIKSYFQNKYLNYQNPTILPVALGAGETSFYCVNLAVDSVKAARPSMTISGVLVLHDDALFSYWHAIFNPELFNLSKSYVMAPGLVYDIDTLQDCDDVPFALETNCTRPDKWNWPTFYNSSILSFYKELSQLARKNNSMQPTQVYRKCYFKIKKRTKGPHRVLGGLSDMYYIAKDNLQTAMDMFFIAAKHRAFQEIIVPTVFACFDNDTVGYIDKTADYANPSGRRAAWDIFDARRLLMHPFKLSSLVRATFGDNRARIDSQLDICLYCWLTQYTKFLTTLYEQIIKT